MTRDDLIDNFELIWKKDPIRFYENLTDFIIEDRKRILAPLVKLINSSDEFKWHVTRTKECVYETIKLAGVE